MRINLHIIIEQEKVVVLRLRNAEVALLRTVSFTMMKVANVQTCCAPVWMIFLNSVSGMYSPSL